MPRIFQFLLFYIAFTPSCSRGEKSGSPYEKLVKIYMRNHVLELDPRVWVRGLDSHCEFLQSLQLGHRPDFFQQPPTKDEKAALADYLNKELREAGCYDELPAGSINEKPAVAPPTVNNR